MVVVNSEKDEYRKRRSFPDYIPLHGPPDAQLQLLWDRYLRMDPPRDHRHLRSGRFRSVRSALVLECVDANEVREAEERTVHGCSGILPVILEKETVTSISGVPRELALVYQFSSGGRICTPSFSSMCSTLFIRPILLIPPSYRRPCCFWDTDTRSQLYF